MARDKNSKRRRRDKLDRTGPNRQAAGAIGSNSGFIEQSLENMYRIVEPWRKQGEGVARQWSRAYGALTVPEGFQETPTRLLRSSGELMAAWVDLLALYSDFVLPNWNGESDGGAGSDSGRSGKKTDIAYIVDSRATVYVHAEIESDAHKFELAAPDIRKSDGIRVRFDNENKRRIAVSVKVKKRAALGSYESNIVNTYNGEILGHLRIELE